MTHPIERLGRGFRIRVEGLGYATCFLIKILGHVSAFFRVQQELRRAFYDTGVLSCLIILVSGLFIGMVVALEGFHTLQKFGATSALGQLLVLSVVRELGPVVSALLFAGRAGSALTAEIGLMKATEQLSSMTMMGVDPLIRVMYPRLMAGWMALPLLAVIFSMVAIQGGYWLGVYGLHVDSGVFWSNMQANFHVLADLVPSIIKSIVFGLLVMWVAVYQGYTCVPTAEGISQATTRSVVYGSLAVLGMDLILTAMMIGE